MPANREVMVPGLLWEIQVAPLHVEVALTAHLGQQLCAGKSVAPAYRHWARNRNLIVLDNH